MLDFGKGDLALTRGFKSGKCETAASVVSKPGTGRRARPAGVLLTDVGKWEAFLFLFHFNGHQEGLWDLGILNASQESWVCTVKPR